jgi:hypothetical protein
MKKAPEGMGRGRNTNHQFCRIYPILSDASSGKCDAERGRAKRLHAGCGPPHNSKILAVVQPGSALPEAKSLL